MADQYYNNGLNYNTLVSITPNDSTELNLRAIQVTDDTSGNAVAIKIGDMASSVVMYCTKGVIYPVGGKDIIVLSTGTTADTIIGFR